MKQSDRILLDGLRSTVLADIPQSHWEEVEKAVEDAGDVREVSGYARTIVFDAIEVAKASFATRSEAGRYAANMRWKGQAGSKGRKAELAAKFPNADMIIDLPNPLGERSAADSARIAANVKRLREERGKDSSSADKDELRAYIEENEGLLERMQDLGESAADIKTQQNLIAQAKRDLDGKSSNKKPFLDLTDIDPSGSMESGSAKPASAKPTKTSEVKPETVTRIKEGNLSDISRVIRRDLKAQNKKVPFGAEPYLEALDTMDNIGDMYGADSGSSIVAYALSNLSSYKGPVAREVKAELKRRLKAKK